MQPLVRSIRHAACGLALIAAAAGAQVTETPVSFDRSGTVRSITPPFVDRLGLKPPIWPVQDDFVAARLYSVSSGGFVLAVERRDGRIDRLVLSTSDADALRAAVSDAVTRAGSVVIEDRTSDISEPARGPFVRNQMLLSALMYAPALSALTHDATAGTGLYLLSIGGSYFVVSSLAKDRTITKAENKLATDGALRLPGVLFGSYYAAGVDEPSADLGAATFLVGGIGGSILGYTFGRGLTTSEASAMTFGSTFAALTTLGVVGTTGLANHNGRATAGLTVAAGLAGYAAGPMYPRHARYAVTAGDITTLSLAGILGAMATTTTIIGNDHTSTSVASAVLTAGMLGGVWIGDRTLVRRYDHTESEAGLVWLGGIAGAVMGSAIPVLARNDDNTFVLSSVTAGAILGTIAAENLVAPRVGSVRVGMRDGGRGVRHAGLSFDPGALALAALGAPGRYSIARLTF